MGLGLNHKNQNNMETAKKSTKEQILAWVYTILALTPIFIIGYMLGEELNKVGF